MKQNQFKCWFISRKGNCKQGNKRGKVCRLKNLLSRNGNGNASEEIQKTFLECYLLNSKNSKKAGKEFFKTTFVQLTGKKMKPLTEYQTNVLLDTQQGKSTHITCMFRIPQELMKFEKIWNRKM